MRTNLLLTFLIVVMVVVSVPQVSYSQGYNEDVPVTSSGPRKQLATIVFSGLAGAILGLSTLSFYGRPQDKLSNIAVGFAIGIISGTLYTTYKTATQPYGALEIERQLHFAELDQRLSTQSGKDLNLNYEWSF